ncbi:MAG: DUF1294 domain-containing protein [bacterium]|nr:DUF1294 domain-containing protein [bacterium]
MSLRAHPVRSFLGLYLVLVLALAWFLARQLGAGAPDASRGSTLGTWLAAWLIAANVLVVPFWAWDKRQAMLDRFRVPEAALHLFAAAGAAAASLIAMRTFRHKTLKPKFKLLYWTLLGVQVALVVWLLQAT